MRFLENTEKGFAQLVVLGFMALMAVALPLTTNLVKQSQENRSKAAEEGTMSCSVLRDTSKKYFEVCADFDNVCFNKNTGEYQGCGNINGSNGGDCTDTEHNTNANSNMLCSVKNNVSLSCEILYSKKQKYFATCAGAGNTGACFDKQTGEYKGCVNNNGNGCDGSDRILCSVKSNDLDLWTNAAGKCGSAYGKTFESTPTSDLCESGEFSRAWFIESGRRYYWKCGDVAKYGNEAANCFAIVNGKVGSSKITLDRTEVSLGVDQSIKVNAKLDPVSSNDSIKWSTNLPEYFSVDSSGLITVLKGSASGYVTAMTSDGYGASVMVNTTEETEKVDGVCGSAHGKTFLTRPENNLCSSSVNYHGEIKGNKYIWVCSGANGGSSVECWANIENSSPILPTMTSITSNPYLFLRTDKNIYSVGQTFTVIAGVNSTTNKIGGVDGVLNYKTDVLSLLSVKKSSNFVFKNSDDDCVINQNFTNGKVVFTCFVGDSANDKAVNGELVILTFAVKHSGVSDIVFECNPGAISDSNIVVDSKDVIDCSKNINQKISTNNSSLSNSPRCGLSGTYKTTPPRDSLCEVGDPISVLVNRTTMVYTWKCVVGNETKSCSARPATNNGGLQKITPTPLLVGSSENISSIDGRCGSKRNTCANGIVNDGDLPDSGSDYKWRCLGLEGGKNVSCSLKKPVNGRCGAKKRTCITGTVNDGAVADAANLYKWKCVGKYNGKTVNCSAKK